MTFRCRSLRLGLFVGTLSLAAAPGFGQDAGSGTVTAPPAQQTAASVETNDARVDPLQPDFSLVALPVTLRMPEHKLAFRVTHRFTRSLGEGDAGDLFSNFFGFDSGAQIGLEVRYGVRPGTQVGIHRTSDRTIELFGQQSVWQQRDGRPLGLDVIATFEGQDNLHAQKSPAVGALLSRKAARVAAIYAEPIVVFNTDPAASGIDRDTFMIGLGTRVRVRPSTYIAGEITARAAGYTPGVNQISFGLEERVGGHLFQVNVGNGLGTTLGQLARGGVNNRSWFIGFNIARKFF